MVEELIMVILLMLMLVWLVVMVDRFLCRMVLVLVKVSEVLGLNMVCFFGLGDGLMNGNSLFFVVVVCGQLLVFVGQCFDQVVDVVFVDFVGEGIVIGFYQLGVQYVDVIQFLVVGFFFLGGSLAGLVYCCVRRLFVSLFLFWYWLGWCVVV